MNAPVHNLFSSFRAIADAHSDHAAITYDGLTLTYAALFDRSVTLARDWAARASLSPGTRMVVLENDPLEIITAIFAGWSLGTSVAVIRPDVPMDQLGNLIDRLNPSLITGAPKIAAQAEKHIPDRDKICAAHEECLVTLTSGSTSRPKAVAMPASGLELGIRAVAEFYHLDSQDKVQVATSLTFGLGLNGGALPALIAGAHILAHPPSTLPTTLHSSVKTNGITIVLGPSSLFEFYRQYWSEEPFETVRLVHQGGEPMSSSLGAWLSKAYPNARIIRAFGMTECVRVTHVDLSNPEDAGNYQGRPHDFWKLKFVDPGVDHDDDVGILAIKGPSLMLGYVGTDGGYEGLDNQGYLVTNDLMTQDAEGNLYYHGRADRCFKTGGQMVNPAMVEQALRRHPDVRLAVCKSKTHPVLGHVPVATITVNPASELSASGAKAFCKNLLEQHMVPQHITIMHKAELAPSGKFARRSD